MPKLDSIDVPKHLQRNAPDVSAHGVEETGASLLAGMARRLGRTDLAGLDLLDIGCGVRFTQTLINRDLAFTSYTGIEVFRPIVEWLGEHVEKHDERFRFVHWDVYNARYNPRGVAMSTQERFPVAGDFDVAMGFSLFTHLDPPDAACMLRLTRQAVRRGGFLYFSAFCDNSIDEFEDRVPQEPLLKAYYNKKYLECLIKEADWNLLSYAEPSGYMMNSFLCQAPS